jgi:hypothetical protein
VTFFTFRFFKFYFSAMLSHPFPPAILSVHRLVCFFAGPPPCYKIFPVFLSPVLSRRGAICPPAALGYVAPSRADDVCSPDRVAISLGDSGVWDSAAGMADRGSVSMNYADPGHPRCLQNSFYSFLCCIFALLREEKRRGKKNKGKTAFQQVQVGKHLSFWGYYVLCVVPRMFWWYLIWQKRQVTRSLLP